MNPAELKLLENVNKKLNALRQDVSAQAHSFGVLKDSYLTEIKTLGEQVKKLKEGVEGIVVDFTPYVAKVALPEHMRTLPQQTVMDVVDGMMGKVTMHNPYPVSHGDEVLVMSGIINKPGMVVVCTESGRLDWPLPATIFEKVT